MIDTKIDKSVFDIRDLSHDENESTFWLKKTPQESIYVIEMLRKINYGKDAATERLQRFFEIAELS